jgi:hypothetical protein
MMSRLRFIRYLVGIGIIRGGWPIVPLLRMAAGLSEDRAGTDIGELLGESGIMGTGDGGRSHPVVDLIRVNGIMEMRHRGR